MHVGANIGMTRAAGGGSANVTQRRMLQGRFCEQFGISTPQYERLLTLCDSGGLDDFIPVDVGVSLPAAPSIRPVNPLMFLGNAESYCCGRSMRVREIVATVYDVGSCTGAVHVVKTCRGHCGVTYYYNKRVLPGIIGPDNLRCNHHVYDSWVDGIPDYVASKSGKFFLSAGLLKWCVVNQCRLR